VICLGTLGLTDCDAFYSDILHPNRANISKEELREKLGSLYKAQKDQISVFGLRTQFGGGKTTGFALVYDSPEAMKKFEPQYRLVRVGLATKAERASRQQRAYTILDSRFQGFGLVWLTLDNRQAAQEPTKDPPRYGKGQGCQGEEGEINDGLCISSGWLGSGCSYVCGCVHSMVMRVRPFTVHPRWRRHWQRVQGLAGGRGGYLDSARGSEGFAFIVIPQYTSMKSMVFFGFRTKNKNSNVSVFHAGLVSMLRDCMTHDLITARKEHESCQGKMKFF
jgi:ribosomal protein S24E